MENKHLGTGFDEFLEQEGLRADTEAVAIKRVIAYQIEQEMERVKISKSEMAAKMHTSRPALSRLLDPNNPINDPTAPPKDRPNVAVTGTTVLRSASRSGRGGKVELTGDDLLLG